MTFELHPRLAADTIELEQGPLSLCKLLLMNDCTYPWLIMVPERGNIKEIHELSVDDQVQLVTEISTISSALQRATGAPKMNVAALGNMVPQLHIHVIARFENDSAWPGPIWGKVPVQPYQNADKNALIKRLTSDW